jgi:hypothetical protein
VNSRRPKQFFNDDAHFILFLKYLFDVPLCLPWLPVFSYFAIMNQNWV